MYVGNGKGMVSLWQVKSLEQCGSWQLPSATAVRNIQVHALWNSSLQSCMHTSTHDARTGRREEGGR